MIASDTFGILEDGRSVRVHTLRNAAGVTVRVLDYGGIIQSLEVPDAHGRLTDVVLGFDTLDSYTAGSPYFGALIGRYGNRIARGRFTLDGHLYTLATNDGPNHLHGGVRGFDKRVWAVEPFDAPGRRGLVLSYASPDGEEGYPGTLRATVRYTLADDARLTVAYEATSDRTTPVNLTQHSYFDLAGAGAGDVLGHLVTIAAQAFTPVDETLIPTGEIRGVAGTPFDFRAPTPLGARMATEDRQLRIGGGYDHNFVLDAPAAVGRLRLAARVREPGGGRVLEVHTDQPGLQLYSGNHLAGIRGKGGAVYGPHAGLALETQHFPDSPNHPAFPSTILRPGEVYRTTTEFRFPLAG